MGEVRAVYLESPNFFLCGGEIKFLKDVRADNFR